MKTVLRDIPTGLAQPQILLRKVCHYIIDKTGMWKDPAMKLVYTKETDQEVVDIISKHV